ncbi:MULTISPECIES: DUF2845 domain-containing protein [Pseudomonas]|uniref:DUF2845 domain-containing protein n=1 Tax=Pseudomonas segetis TaxID=298908 RepID=A0A239DE04_9PSED|nr:MULTISPECIES: DUF2845 domain-containing protein [Pseudomonas]SNS30560.1 Protein of unknown function [Pseudomonas segetis]
MLKLLCSGLMGLLVYLMALSSAHASMRCSNGIIDEGDLTLVVLEKCGEPNTRQIIPPQTESNGQIKAKSVTVENWVYGPDNGAYKYLKFIDGKLVKIDSGRL